MNNYIIYIHKNKVNGKIYVGQTCQQPNERWRNGFGYIQCPKFWKAIVKYGWDNFEHIILETDLTLEQANEKERYYIQYYNSNSKEGYNCDIGGNNQHMSEEHKQHIQQGIEKSIGRPVICLNNLKIYPSAAAAERDTGCTHIFDCCVGRLKHSGKDENGMGLQWKYLEEYDKSKPIQLEKILDNSKKKILLENTNEIFESLREASRKYNVNSGSISACCQGKRRSAGKDEQGNKLIWRFV